ncbi:MAG TPA: cyclic nucleotide-binding domain-containing protein [Candidatus Binatia bacterium]|jgi:signal-transduction protein with cAMP-binding, CBS, and nucleotidyltransferase domain
MAIRLAARLFLPVGVFALAFGTSSANLFAVDKAAGSELSSAISQAKLFAGLTDQEKTALEAAASLRHGAQGERIIEQGKSSGKMFIVLEGQAEVRINGKSVATLPEQSLVGEVEFLDGPPGTGDVVLSKDTDLIVLDNAALGDLMKKQPRLGYALMSEIARIEARRLKAMNPK